MKNILWIFPLLALSLAAYSCSKKEEAQPHPTPTGVLVEIPFPEISPTPGTPTSALTQAAAAEPTPMEYVLEDLRGTVMILSQGETQSEPAQEEETIDQGDEIITKEGAEASLTLNENTMFHLSSNSDIKIAQLESHGAEGFISRIELTAGKILSEVEKLQESDSTYEVESGGVVCGVRGTAFQVQTEGAEVQTDTFHGVVEMKKNSLVQRIESNQRSSFSLKSNGFLKQRALNRAERESYQAWLPKRTLVSRKFRQRAEFFRSMDHLPPQEKQELFKKLGESPRRDRLRMMHQLYQDKYQEDPKRFQSFQRDSSGIAGRRENTALRPPAARARARQEGQGMPMNKKNSNLYRRPSELPHRSGQARSKTQKSHPAQGQPKRTFDAKTQGKNHPGLFGQRKLNRGTGRPQNPNGKNRKEPKKGGLNNVVKKHNKPGKKDLPEGR